MRLICLPVILKVDGLCAKTCSRERRRLQSLVSNLSEWISQPRLIIHIEHDIPRLQKYVLTSYHDILSNIFCCQLSDTIFVVDYTMSTYALIWLQQNSYLYIIRDAHSTHIQSRLTAKILCNERMHAIRSPHCRSFIFPTAHHNKESAYGMLD